MVSSYDDSYPSRPSSHRPRRSRPMVMSADYNNYVDGPSCGSEKHTNTMLSSQQQQAVQLSPEKLTEPHIFDFFYSLIFSLVHSALTAVLSPVLSSTTKTVAKRTSGRRRGGEQPQSSRSLHHHQQQVEQPQRIIEDPEIGTSIPQYPPPVVDDSDCMSVASHTSHSSSCSRYRRNSSKPILRTQGSGGSSSSRRNSEMDKKSVHFPIPERARPPLGRINARSSSSVGSGSSDDSSPSSLPRLAERGTESTTTTTTRRPSSRQVQVAPIVASSRPRRTLSPFRMNTPRMAHSSYFLE